MQHPSVQANEVGQEQQRSHGQHVQGKGCQSCEVLLPHLMAPSTSASDYAKVSKKQCDLSLCIMQAFLTVIAREPYFQIFINGKTACFFPFGLPRGQILWPIHIDKVGHHTRKAVARVQNGVHDVPNQGYSLQTLWNKRGRQGPNCNAWQ